MPRTPRIDYPGARHHVMNRGIRREAMFLDDEACAAFVDALAEVPRRFDARVHGYALMPNHYHLMIEVPRGNLSDVMKHVGATFTQAFNRQRGHDGPVFRGRFRNEVVQDDAYWMHLLAYLHLNPVRAHLARRPEECMWTSHNAYVDPSRRPRWLTCSELLGMFGGEEAVRQYVRDVRLGRRQAPGDFDPERFFTGANTVAVPEPPPRVLRTPEQAIADVAEVLGIPVSAVLERRRGRKPNLGAWLAAWWLIDGAGLSQAEVARRLGVSRPRVSQLYNRVLTRAPTDEALSNAMGHLQERGCAGVRP